ncbi:Hydroxyproline-rich glycoprotein family protein [Rhynchospora pubera]|uniref:Hydroxyproline-rich glycoprotein family protein n=1 Tax=Rhynchospora pubera TaxID=906938 RepID=A0AAV8DLH3_9POAL|nr:Hydroxyproline-rich glycoprotein family protein [Rhynchospora pubera]
MESMDQNHDTDINEDHSLNLSLTLGTPPSSRLFPSYPNPNSCPKPQSIPQPYPWATTRRATLHTLHHILSLNLTTITDTFRCRRCDSVKPVMYNILEKYNEVINYIINNRDMMFNRAAPEWLSPRLPDCHMCGGAGSMRPVIAVKKRHINWLFLLLGQTLGCCNLDQLKYFCKHSKNHRTGSKSHVLYLTYLGLCNQLDPSFPCF